METAIQIIDAASGITKSFAGFVAAVGMLLIAVSKLRRRKKRSIASAKNIPPAKATSLDAKVALKKEARVGFGVLSLGMVPLTATFIVSEPLSRGYVVFCSFMVPITLFALMRYAEAATFIEAVEEKKAQQAATANDAQRDR
jgi:hypothetical protein